jgi:hypothetical protein
LAQRDLSCGVTYAVRQNVPLFLPTTLVAVPRHTHQQIDREQLFVLSSFPAVTNTHRHSTSGNRATGNKLHVLITVIQREEVTGEWRKLHNEELRDLYSSRRRLG